LGDSNTNVYAAGTSIQFRSDSRDKAEIRDTILGLDFINKLRPVDYKWDLREDYREIVDLKDLNDLNNLNNSNIDSQKTFEIIEHEKDGSKIRNRFHHGLIAQEIEQVIKENNIDFGGFQDHKINGGSDVLTIGYSELFAPLIKAIQELSIEIKNLKEENTIIKDENRIIKDILNIKK
jgi:hypothetical protein